MRAPLIILAIVVLSCAGVSSFECKFTREGKEYDVCDLKKDGDYTETDGANTVYVNVGVPATKPEECSDMPNDAVAYVKTATNCIWYRDSDVSPSRNDGEGFKVTLKGDTCPGQPHISPTMYVLVRCDLDTRKEIEKWEYNANSCEGTVVFSHGKCSEDIKDTSFTFWDFMFLLLKWSFICMVFCGCIGCCAMCGYFAYAIAQGKDIEIPFDIPYLTNRRHWSNRRRTRGGVYQPVSAYEQQLMDFQEGSGYSQL